MSGIVLSKKDTLWFGLLAVFTLGSCASLNQQNNKHGYFKPPMFEKPGRKPAQATGEVPGIPYVPGGEVHAAPAVPTAPGNPTESTVPGMGFLPSCALNFSTVPFGAPVPVPTAMGTYYKQYSVEEALHQLSMTGTVTGSFSMDAQILQPYFYRPRLNSNPSAQLKTAVGGSTYFGAALGAFNPGLQVYRPYQYSEQIGAALMAMMIAVSTSPGCVEALLARAQWGATAASARALQQGGLPWLQLAGAVRPEDMVKTLQDSWAAIESSHAELAQIEVERERRNAANPKLAGELKTKLQRGFAELKEELLKVPGCKKFVEEVDFELALFGNSQSAKEVLERLYQPCRDRILPRLEKVDAEYEAALKEQQAQQKRVSDIELATAFPRDLENRIDPSQIDPESDLGRQWNNLTRERTKLSAATDRVNAVATRRNRLDGLRVMFERVEERSELEDSAVEALETEKPKSLESRYAELQEWLGKAERVALSARGDDLATRELEARTRLTQAANTYFLYGLRGGFELAAPPEPRRAPDAARGVGVGLEYREVP